MADDDDFWDSILGNNPNSPTATQFANGLGQGGVGFGSPPLANAFLSQPPVQQPATPAAAMPAFAYSPPPMTSNSGGPISSLLATGLGASVIADMLPQLDTGLPSRAQSVAYINHAPLPWLDALSNDPSLSSSASLLGNGANGGAPRTQNAPGVHQVPVTGQIQNPDAPSATFLSPSSLQPLMPLQEPNSPPPTVDQLAMMYGISPEQVATISNRAKIAAVARVGLKDLLGPAVEYLFPEENIAQSIARPSAALAIDTANQISEPSDEQYIQDAPDRAVYQYLNDTLAQPLASANVRALRSRFPFP